MKAKLIKKENKVYVQLPEEFASLSEVEVSQLKGLYWLISPPIQEAAERKLSKAVEEKQNAKPPKPELTAPEDKVLQKLLAIRFEGRTPSRIEKLFSLEEQDVLRQLIKKGYVQVFYGDKYSKTGVYNIVDNIYPLIGAKKHEQKPQETAKAPQPKSPVSEPRALYSELMKKGWLVISDQRAAEQFSNEIKKMGLASRVKGVRGFDSRFYVATSGFVLSAYPKIKALLEVKDAYLQELAETASLDPEGVLTVLRILSESGEIIEKKRGLFCLA